MSAIGDSIAINSIQLAQEYLFISEKDCLNESQEERLSYILNEAINDKLLDSFIQYYELADECFEGNKIILDQQSKMREYLFSGANFLCHFQEAELESIARICSIGGSH